MSSRVILVTGLQASGKSTVAPMLAKRLGPPAAALDGDVFYTMVKSGNVDMTPDPDPEALRQLQLRYDASALVARQYVQAGFDFVCSEIIMGEHLVRWMDQVGDVEKHLVVLNPSTESIVARELGRGSAAYEDWLAAGMDLAASVDSMRAELVAMPQRGLWLDTTEMTAEEAVEAILADGLAASKY
ncbi:AAA family ATPase [Kribbella deserti]|uniref:AAA family ATPase n=1 Tax=Kribbella deserti TaxID=1926257 RepID=A0ABV6QLW8_9ACTN